MAATPSCGLATQNERSGGRWFQVDVDGERVTATTVDPVETESGRQRMAGKMAWLRRRGVQFTGEGDSEQAGDERARDGTAVVLSTMAASGKIATHASCRPYPAVLHCLPNPTGLRDPSPVSTPPPALMRQRR
jgi:hypothetical protein